jgi:hypothetical protein
MESSTMALVLITASIQSKDKSYKVFSLSICSTCVQTHCLLMLIYSYLSLLDVLFNCYLLILALFRALDLLDLDA